MKVFNQEVNNCENCIYLGDGLYCLQLEKDIYDTFDDDDSYIFSKENHIYIDCPFNKPLTKEDIESFGFTTKNNGLELILNFSYLEYKLQYYPKLQTLNIISHKVLFDGEITSKPHLEFILQSLNII